MAQAPQGRGSGRARDARGRFMSAKAQRQIASAEAGTVYAVNVGGAIRYRDERGRWVAADIAAATRGGARRQVRAKGGSRKVVAPKGKLKASDEWEGKRTRVRALYVRGQSLSKIVEGNAVDQADTFVRWKGRVYRVTPEKAAAISDILRVVVSDYMQDFKGLVDYPEYTVAVYETSAGDLIDIDDLTLFNEGLEDDLIGDEDAERAAIRFNQHITASFERVIPKRNATPQSSKDQRRPTRRDRTPGKTGKRRKRRDSD